MLKFILISFVLIHTVKSIELSSVNERSLIQGEKSQELCGFCVLAFERLQSVLQQNVTEENIKNLLDNVCLLLPNQEESKNCLDLVQKNLHDLYNIIRSNLDPGIICRVLKLCNDSFLRSEISAKPTSSLEVSSSFKCDLCQVAVEVVDYELKNNSTELSITKALENLCKIFPSSSFRNECFQVIGEFGPAVLDIIGNDLRPDLVCKFITFCEASPSLNHIATNKPVKDSFECTACETAVEVADSLLKLNVTQDNIINFSSIILCSVLFNAPDLKDQCGSFVLEYGKSILDMIIRGMDQQKICSAIKLCKNSNSMKEKEAVKIISKSVTNTVECELCDYLATIAEEYVKNNISEFAILDDVSKVCNLFSGELQEQCKSLIAQFGPSIIQALENSITPAVICNTLGFCKNNTIVKPEIILQSLESVECELCDYLVKEAESFLKTNKSEEEIFDELSKVCDLFSNQIRPQCSAFVTEYGPYVVYLLVNDISPNATCKFLRFCKDNSKTIESKVEIISRRAMTKTLDSIRIIKKKSVNTIECELCDYLVQAVDVFLKTNKSEEEIFDELSKVCDFFSGQIKPQCSAFVNEYGPYVVYLLVNDISPNAICKLIGMCKGNTKSIHTKINISELILKSFLNQINLKPKSKFSDYIECELCDFLVKTADSIVQTNKTEEEIFDELSKVCYLFSIDIQPQCSSFVNEYGPYVILMLVNDITPNATCKALGLCKNNNSNILKLKSFK